MSTQTPQRPPSFSLLPMIRAPVVSVHKDSTLVDTKSDSPVAVFGVNSLYRPNVAAHVFNERGEFLACLRMDARGWQCVQGGVEKKDKDIVKAALRELEEEVGLTIEAGLVYVGEVHPPTASELVKIAALSGLLKTKKMACKPTPVVESSRETEEEDDDVPDYRYFRYTYPGHNPRRTRLGQEQRQLLFFLPSMNIDRVTLVPNADKFGPKVTQEFREVRWMDYETLFKHVGAHKEHIFAYVFLKALGMMKPVLAAYSQPIPAAESAREGPTSQTKNDEGERARLPTAEH